MLKSDSNRDKVTVENKRVVQFVQFSKCSHSSIVWSKINDVSETSKSKSIFVHINEKCYML